MASAKTPPPLSTRVTSSRLPPPSLFQGPPSRNASGISLGLPSTIGGSSRNNSVSFDPNALTGHTYHQSSGSRRPRRQSQSAPPQSEHDRADAMWMEMQNTLAEVELSAENTNHVFGGEHARALEELGHAQLALAQAWARSAGDELQNSEQDKDKAAATTKADEGLLTDAKAPVPAARKEGGGDIEEETEADILMARKRREANDRYFQRVNAGVLDVVAKLEEVALAMKKVEKESRDIWSETESFETTEITEATPAD